MTNINKTQILRFLKQECTEEETISAKKYLSSHPEILEEFLTWEDWESIQERKEQLILSENDTEKLWNRITKNLTKSKNKWVPFAAATIVLIVVLLTLNGLKTRKPYINNDREIVNIGKDIKKIILSDSSQVELYPNSKLVIAFDFNTETRHLFLTGRGSFKVAKNKRKPFVVTSGPIKTTALGTYFQVEDFSNKQYLIVRLYEGKIKVANNNLNKDSIFLHAGDSIIYDKISQVFIRNTQNHILINKTKYPPIFKSAPNSINVWYKFDNQRLEEVFDRLEVLYNTKIQFYNTSKDSIYFIGQFRKADNLFDILHTITILNDLELVKINDHYYKVIKK